MLSRACWCPATFTSRSSPPSALHRIGDELRAEGLILDVPGQRHGFPAGFFDQGDDLLRIGLFARQVIESDVRSFASESDRRRTADARVGPGDQGLPALEAAEALVALLAVIGLRVHFPRQTGNRLRLLGKLNTGILLRRVLHLVLILGRF